MKKAMENGKVTLTEVTYLAGGETKQGVLAEDSRDDSVVIFGGYKLDDISDCECLLYAFEDDWNLVVDEGIISTAVAVGEEPKQEQELEQPAKYAVNFFKVNSIIHWAPFYGLNGELLAATGHGYHKYDALTSEGYGYFYSEGSPLYEFQFVLEDGQLCYYTRGFGDGCFWQKQYSAEPEQTEEEPEPEKLWYAVLTDDDNDWGTGSTNYNEAVEIAGRLSQFYDCVIIATISESDGDKTCVSEEVIQCSKSA